MSTAFKRHWKRLSEWSTRGSVLNVGELKGTNCSHVSAALEFQSAEKDTSIHLGRRGADVAHAQSAQCERLSTTPQESVWKLGFLPTFHPSSLVLDESVFDCGQHFSMDRVQPPPSLGSPGILIAQLGREQHLDGSADALTREGGALNHGAVAAMANEEGDGSGDEDDGGRGSVRAR